MSNKILIVEDEREIADTLEYALKSAGMHSVWVTSGADALQQLQQESFDLSILDVGLPDCDGFELLKQIRQGDYAGSQIPVLFLTARNDEIDRIVGLEIGADDYVCKPFSPREVVARVKAILKRSQHVSNSQDLDSYASDNAAEAETQGSPFEVDQHRLRISLEGRALALTRSEFKLLETFLAQPGRVFSRRQLIEQVFSDHHPSDDRAIDTHVKTLRAKLKSQNPHQDYIVTHRGFGYSINLEVKSS